MLSFNDFVEYLITTLGMVTTMIDDQSLDRAYAALADSTRRGLLVALRDGPAGKRTLRDLFEGRGQLVVYHFMFPPEWDAGCPHCSFWADSFDSSPVHLRARDVSFAAVSRAPLAKISAYKERMGWSFPWYSAGETAFNYDFGVSFPAAAVADGTAVYNYVSEPGLEDREGISAFVQDGQDQVFHTYSTYARGIDPVNSTYQLLDLTARGRDEPAEGNPQFWVRRHDEYDS